MEPPRLTHSEHIPHEQTGTIMPSTATVITARSLYWPDPYPHDDTTAGGTGCILNIVLFFASAWFSTLVVWKWLWALSMDNRVPNLMCGGFHTFRAGAVRLFTAVGCPKTMASIVLICITFSFWISY